MTENRPVRLGSTATINPALKINRVVLSHEEGQVVDVRVDFSLNLIRPTTIDQTQDSITRALTEMAYQDLWLVLCV